ncbi:tetraprenyl-beta-curcumene synthase family protein [Bacillaceae bacterium]
MRFTYRIYRYVLPAVAKELKKWRNKAEQIPDPELRRQAIASMTAKRFHCEGGSVYAAHALAQREILIPLIVAFQTISDYLDNLCDRSTSLNPVDFRQLHRSMLDAVTRGAKQKDYYRYHPEKEDGGYLRSLVETCQSHIKRLPHYGKVESQVREWVGLYCDLQVYKHMEPRQREFRLHRWWEKHRHRFPGIYWQEFAAASGSTLGVFSLFLLASRRDWREETLQRIKLAYFPWICGLHILLDYLIDQEEDRRGGDLNFIHYYRNVEETIDRLGWFARQARKAALTLPDSALHGMIVEGLLGLYLADRKVRQQQDVYRISRDLLKHSRLSTLFFFMNSWLYRG